MQRKWWVFRERERHREEEREREEKETYRKLKKYIYLNEVVKKNRIFDV